MRKLTYYPSRIADQVIWLENYATKLSVHAPNFNISPTDTGTSISDARWCAYVLGEWLPAVRAFAPSTTDAVDTVLTGAGPNVVTLPAFTVPALPSGVGQQRPGALTRIFNLVAKLKLDVYYTEAIGTDLGIVGSQDASSHATPKFTAEIQQGSGVQVVKLVFFKYTHMGVYIESRRSTGAWEMLGIDTVSPYMDERALLTPATPEMREYRMRFWDKGTPNGDWTDVAKVTVSP